MSRSGRGQNSRGASDGAPLSSRQSSVFEVIGSYVVDVFFNHVYLSAKTGIRDGASLTDEYVRRIQTFIVGTKTDESCYRQVINDLHKFFQANTRYVTLTFPAFVDTVVGEMVPDEFYAGFDSRDKDEILNSAICDLVAGLGAYTTTPEMLRRVIDGHTPMAEVTVRMMQDHAVTVLVTKRGDIYNQFLRQIGQTKETVSIEVVTGLQKQIDKLKHALQDMAEGKAHYKAKYDDSKGLIEELQEEIDDLKTRDKKFKKLVAMFQAERSQGVQGAAIQHVSVPPNTIAERAPNEHAGWAPGPNYLAEPRVPPRAAPARGALSDFFAPASQLPTRAPAPSIRSMRSGASRTTEATDDGSESDTTEG